MHEARPFTRIPEHPVEPGAAPEDWLRKQIMPAVRTDLEPNRPGKRRLKPAASRTARFKQGRMQRTDVDEPQPPDLPLVRLPAIGTPALGAPAAPPSEQAPLPHAEELREGEVREAPEIRVPGQTTDGRGDLRTTVADVEAARTGGNAALQYGTSPCILQGPPDEHQRRNRDLELTGLCGAPHSWANSRTWILCKRGRPRRRRPACGARMFTLI